MKMAVWVFVTVRSGPGTMVVDVAGRVVGGIDVAASERLRRYW